jgi:mono/diheme cytochrome c family protein
MHTMNNAVLALVFLGLCFANAFLMYRLLCYPFDTKTKKRTSPRPLIILHRIIGYSFCGIYVYMMFQMVPRLWSYQIELPARAVAHLTLGMLIGIILLIKIPIVRFFKPLSQQMAPILGTALLISTALLVSLSVPITLREAYLNKGEIDNAIFSAENIERVKRLLSKAGFEEEVPLKDLSSISGLRKGRQVLIGKCVQCHNLRTVLMLPKTPEQWIQTVKTMSERSLLARPINKQEQMYVSAYLIAISPKLQETANIIRKQKLKHQQSKKAVEAIKQKISTEYEIDGETEFTEAQELFEETCCQCHDLSVIDKNPPYNTEEAINLVSRMLENGLDISEEQYMKIVSYLTKKYGTFDRVNDIEKKETGYIKETQGK